MDIVRHIIRFVVVMLLQVLLLNHLQLWGLCHPYLYVLCLLMLPVTMPVSVDMLIGFAVGLLMDMFCNSPGIHAAACVLVMFIRQRMVRNLVTEFERLTGEISLSTIGMEAFLRYTVALVLVHHTVIFLLSAWGFSHFGWTLLQILVSAAVTLVLIMLYNSIRQRR